MDITLEAQKVWDQLPSGMRMRALNNIWCDACQKKSSVGYQSIKIEDGALSISGQCTRCNDLIGAVFDIEPSSNKDVFEPPSLRMSEVIGIPNPDISKICQFRRNTKPAKAIKDMPLLEVRAFGPWSPEAIFAPEDREFLPPVSRAVYDLGSRPVWELESVIPGVSLENPDCPITEGIELIEANDWYGAIRLMKELIKQDPRCIDAYAHLGAWYLEYGEPHEISMAKSYYKMGVAIGLKSMAERVNDVFPWEHVENRPFLRCLHGLGLCLYRQHRHQEAVAVFSKMIWMNPSDNLGARMLIDDIEQGKVWPEEVFE